MTNHYQTLGVNRDAGPDEIKRAYRRLASQHHPDKGGDKTKFQEIQQAYDTLGNDQKRAEYDNPLSRNAGFGFQSGSNGPFNFDSIFDIFGARFQHPHQQMRQIARMTLWITLTDVAQGGRRTVSIGTQQGTQAIEIEIPLGINDGDTVQYPQVAPGGLDLQITFRIHPNPAWSRNGLNLTQEHTLSIWDLILGTEITVADISGNHLTVTIPAGTQPNAVFRLKGRGLKPRTGAPGDMFVQIQARIPTVIDPELREMIRQIRPQ
jgi:molecular chaperone DnaJ